jgi:beta-glucosidase
LHSTSPSAHAGLAQDSGLGLQSSAWLGAEKLGAALAKGEIDQARIDLMAGRILTAMFAHGLIDDPVTGTGPIDFAASRAVAQADAEAGIVLLKNEGDLLPIAATARRIAVIGGHADKGVLSGGGSSQVYPEGENAVPGLKPTTWPGPVVYYPSSPLEELKKLLPDARIDYADGSDPAAAAKLAKEADLAIVFGTQWATESIDVPMKLDGEQDALIDAVAGANKQTVVVLETGGPVLTPWAAKVPAIVEAWYPGRMGGAAIANVLSGKVNPSGHLPMTFPKALDQLPYPGEPRKMEATYTEGATVGYKWFDARNLTPQFPFGHGLSYTSFAYSDLELVRIDKSVIATVTVTNTGERAGADAVQLYVSPPPGSGWEAPKRLAAFAKVTLWPGHGTRVSMAIDPRLLSVWDQANPGWSRVPGAYTFSAAHSSRDLGKAVAIDLPEAHLSPQWRP